ncbi:hypothetical protein GARC_4099 [Paraglaciecola arctica BSs20135]|uniref:Uncharacterized protein n=1 Tax=Paraglaciecola arctica BSs20135 TaxID=493475 RepID=K6YAQ8_9ALTE|nr:hypothetical protein GARC_4099 [Paraglaciecola arctica BSs20135]
MVVKHWGLAFPKSSLLFVQSSLLIQTSDTYQYIKMLGSCGHYWV